MAIPKFTYQTVQARYPQFALTNEWSTEGGLGSSIDVVDGAKNRFEVSTFAPARGTGDMNKVMVFVRKLSPTGVELGGWWGLPPDPGKFDDISAVGVGTSLVLIGNTHDYNPINPRSSWKVVGTIPNVFVPLAAPAPAPTPRPCVLPGRLPYFDPNATLTRGQFATMLAGAMGWTPSNPTHQTYQDVAVNAPHYAGIEALSERGIISGYPCNS